MVLRQPHVPAHEDTPGHHSSGIKTRPECPTVVKDWFFKVLMIICVDRAFRYSDTSELCHM